MDRGSGGARTAAASPPMLKWSPSHRKRAEVGASQSYSDVVQLRLGHATAEVTSAGSSHLALPEAGAPFTASLDRRKMVYRGRQPPQRSRSASGTKIETSADATCERAKDGRGRPSAMTMRHRSVHLDCLLPRHMQKRDRHSINRSAVRLFIRPSISARGEVKYETTILSFMIVAGALETSTIHVVPKNKAHEAVVKKLPTKMPNQPFEATFRLQVSESVSQ